MSYTNGLDDPSAYFQTKLYTGNSSTQSITFDGNTNMQPDWVWIKSRSATEWHQVHDSVRGVAKYLFTNTTSAEGERSPNDQVTSFNSNGFSLGAGANDSVNSNGGTYASWNWKASNSTSTNSDGDINGTQTVSQTAGFSVTTYSGNGGSNQRLGHGLGVTPKVYICKRRDNTGQWLVVNTLTDGTLDYSFLESTAAKSNSGRTLPTSSVVYLENGGDANESGGTHVMYAFAEKQGYSKFGKFSGNSSATDGVYIHLGFKAAWFMCKRTNASGHDWVIFNNKALGYNADNNTLLPNSSAAEGTADRMDILSNGVKMYNNNGSENESGGEYIFMAFAENPFVTSTGVPATAR